MTLSPEIDQNQFWRCAVCLTTMRRFARAVPWKCTTPQPRRTAEGCRPLVRQASPPGFALALGVATTGSVLGRRVLCEDEGAGLGVAAAAVAGIAGIVGVIYATWESDEVYPAPAVVARAADKPFRLFAE